MPYNIYNLTNENTGGEIVTYDAGAALTVSNLGGTTGGYALNLISGATTNLNVTGMPVGIATIAPLVRFVSGSTASNVLLIGKTVVSSFSIPMVYFTAASAASAPLFEFPASGGAWVSITSVVLTTVSNFNGAIRIKVGNNFHWIPTLLDAGLVGTGAF